MPRISSHTVRPGKLTLLCFASSVGLLLMSQASFFKGPGGLVLIFPWLAVLCLHLLLGPVALHASWKLGPSLAKPFIYLYFLVFAGVQAWVFIHGSGLDREAQNLWRRHGNPLEAQLHATLQEFEMQKAGGKAPDLAKAAVAVQFVRRGADSNYAGLHGKPFLLRACALGLDDLALTMLQKGADARAADGAGVTPLHAAAAESSPEVVNELLRQGASSDARDAWRNTPLILAVRAGRIDNVTALLAHKPDVDAQDQNSQTPLLEAVARNDIPMVRTLLQAGANANGRDLSRRSVLVMAAAQENEEIARMLLEHGAALNGPAHGHDIPLREALQTGRLDDADALLRMGADVNATTAAGDSLLAEVAGYSVSYRGGMSSKHDLLAWLLQHGADPDGRDRKGRSAFHLASAMSDEKSVRLLRQAGSKP